MTKQDLIKKFGDLYDYSSLPDKFNNHTILNLYCKQHGNFTIRADSHFRSKTGCPKCSYKNMTFTQEEIMQKIANMNNNYTYDKFKYQGMNIKSIITCRIHGDFYQTPAKHILLNQGCPKCALEREPYNKFTKSEFIKKLKNNISSLELISDYYGLKQPVIVKCNICNNIISEYTAWNILYNNCCPECKKIETNKDITQKLNNIINGEYTYSNNEKVLSENNLINIQHKCGYIISRKISIILRHGIKCPICYPSESKGALTIKNYLLKKGINFIQEKTFENLRDKLPLRFDFFIPNKNLLIEFDGEQHFSPRFGHSKEEKIENFNILQKHDYLKNKYASEHNINLLRIRYYEQKHIEQILENYFKT